MDIGEIQFAPRHWRVGGGGVRGSQIQKSEEDVKRLVRVASHLVHMCRFIWEWIYAKQIALRDPRGHLGSFRGSNIQNSGEAVKRLDRVTSADSSGNFHRLKVNTSHPSIPKGACRGGGGVRGSHIQKSWEAVKRLD